MAMQKKSVYILGSMLIGVVTVLAVLLILVGTGVIDTSSRDVVFTSATVEAVYDGTELKSAEWELTSGNLKKGHSAKVTVSGGQLSVGTSENHITAVIVDEQGADVSENYNITCIAGTLTVTPCYYEIKSAAAEKVYDGKPLTAESYTVVAGELPLGHDVTATYSGSITNVGTAQNTFSAIIRDSKNRDVTSNFTLVCTPGRLDVTKRAITFKSQSVEKVYDGEEVKFETADITDSRALVSGQRVEYAFTASIVNVGSVQNAFTAKILSSDGAEVTDNYDVSYDIGTLTVTPRPITFKSETVNKVYDGVEEKSDTAEITDPSALVEGHRVSYTFTESLLDVGSVNNSFTAKISSDGVDVTDNYNITYDVGTFTITPRPVTIESNGDQKEYDGTPLTAIGGRVVEDSLVQGETATITTTGSRTDVGTSPNTFDVVIVNADGIDTTANYDITKTRGNLEVTPRTITIRTNDYTGVYNGTMQTCEEWNIVGADGRVTSWLASGDMTPVPGGTVTVYVTGGRTEIGIGTNLFAVEITGDDGDISANYTIVKEEGIITITSRPLTVRSIDAEWAYDGNPHSTKDDPNAVYVADDTPLIEGHYLSSDTRTIAERTEVGVVTNHISAVKILYTDEYDIVHDVTKNYSISKEPGVLNVMGKSASKLGGGTDDDSIMLWLLSDESETVYLRSQSYGDYEDGAFWSAVEYIQRDQASMNYLTTYAIEKSGVSPLSAIDIKLETGTDFVLPYYAVAAGEFLQKSDVYYYGSAIDYSIERYAYSYSADTIENMKKAFDGDLLTTEQKYREFVYNNYMFVPESTKAVINRIIAENGFSTSNPNLIKAVADYIQNCATYKLDYNRALDEETDIVAAFLTEYKEGICQHYAAAATVMYRTLGIPARYVVGYMGKTQAGVWSKVTAKQAHAWVEVYIDRVGWVFVEVTGTSPSSDGGSAGQGGLQPGEQFTVKPVERFKKYDGTPLTPQNRVMGLSKFLEHDYTYTVSISGSQTEVGYGTSIIESLKLFAPDGALVYSYTAEDGEIDNRTEFVFFVGTGRLHVYYYLIAIKTEGGSKTYDGTELGNENYSFINGTALEKGHYFSHITMGSIVDVGIAVNSFSPVIRDGEGNDITPWYRINVDYGMLEVKPIVITVRTHGLSVTSDELDDDYDGDLTCPYYDVLDEEGNVILQSAGAGEGFKLKVNGKTYTIVCEMTASQSQVGSCDNKVNSIKLTDERSQNVLPFFVVTFDYGKLTVTW